MRRTKRPATTAEQGKNTGARQKKRAANQEAGGKVEQGKNTKVRQWDRSANQEAGDKAEQGKSQVRNYSPEYTGQAPSRGHEASPQSGLGVGCMLCSSSKKLRGLGVSAQARRMDISLLFSASVVFLFLPPPRSAMGRGAWKCNTESR